MVFGILVDRPLLESPLADAPQVYHDTLLIRQLGTGSIALTLYYCFDCATIVTDSAFALFFHPFLTLDSH